VLFHQHISLVAVSLQVCHIPNTNSGSLKNITILIQEAPKIKILVDLLKPLVKTLGTTDLNQSHSGPYILHISASLVASY